MSKFVIPSKKTYIVDKSKIYNLCDEDRQLVENLPSPLITIVSCHIYKSNKYIRDTIEKLQNEHIKCKNQYVIDVKKTYDYIMTELENFLSDKCDNEATIFTCVIDWGDGIFEIGDLESYMTQNPGIRDATNVIISDLNSKGWLPKIELNDANFMDDNSEIILTCDFNE